MASFCFLKKRIGVPLFSGAELDLSLDSPEFVFYASNWFCDSVRKRFTFEIELFCWSLKTPK